MGFDPPGPGCPFPRGFLENAPLRSWGTLPAVPMWGPFLWASPCGHRCPRASPPTHTDSLRRWGQGRADPGGDEGKKGEVGGGRAVGCARCLLGTYPGPRSGGGGHARLMARGPQDTQGAATGTPSLQAAPIQFTRLRCSDGQPVVLLYPDVRRSWSQGAGSEGRFLHCRLWVRSHPAILAVCLEGPEGKTGRPRASPSRQTLL